MSVRVGLGIANFPFSTPAAFFRWVDLCEAGGVDSLWQTDRLATREAYLEAMSAMAALAGATERVKFGMNAVVASLRDPLVLARQCATIDYLSGGRLLPVFGVGSSNAPEWTATGRDPKGRGSRADEALEIMRRLFTEERVDFDGVHYQYRDASIAPRPVQDPLPLWIGGNSRAAMRRTARLGTGWLGGIATAAQVANVLAGIREELAVTGRHIDDDHYGATVLFRFGSRDHPLVQRLAGGALDPGGVLAVGGADEIVARVREYAAAGASKFVLIAVARGDDDVMEHTRRVVAEVIPMLEKSEPLVLAEA